jgi:hypothetical protein
VARTVREGPADGPRGVSSSRVPRVLAQLRFRSVMALSFRWERFRTVRSSGRTVRGCLADGPRVPGGQSAWSPRTVRYSGLSLEVLFALTDGPRLRPDSPRQGSGQSAVPCRTVRAAIANSPRGHREQSARPSRTVRAAWPDGPPEAASFASWFDSSLPFSCFRVCFKESFPRLEVDP